MINEPKTESQLLCARIGRTEREKVSLTILADAFCVCVFNQIFCLIVCFIFCNKIDNKYWGKHEKTYNVDSHLSPPPSPGRNAHTMRTNI